MAGLTAGIGAGVKARKAGGDFWSGRNTPQVSTVNEITTKGIQPFETQGPQGGDLSGLRPIVNTVNEINPASVSLQSQNPYAKTFGSSFDTNNAVLGINGRAQCGSTGYCGRFVRYSLEDGGINTRNALINGELTDAYKYDEFLSKQGFSKIGHRLDSYSPRAGDIMVFDKTINHVSGHIQMFNGTNWVSDFVQQTPYPWSDYGRYSIFRW